MAKAAPRKTNATKRPPWERANPRKTAGKPSTKLTPAQKATAKARAKRAGRRYPNLVDNMRVAAEAKRKPRAAARSSSRATGKRRAD